MAARRLQRSRVLPLLARIAREVLGRAELLRVHEDRCNDAVGLAQRRLHPRQMPLMQRPHGGNERPAEPPFAPAPPAPAPPRNGSTGVDRVGPSPPPAFNPP